MDHHTGGKRFIQGPKYHNEMGFVGEVFYLINRVYITIYQIKYKCLCM